MAIRNMMTSCSNSKWLLLGKESFKSLVNPNQRPLTNIISNIRNEQLMSYGCGTKKLFTNDSKTVLYSFKSSQFPSNGNYQFPTIESRCLYSSSSINRPKKQSDKTKQPDNAKHQSKILTQKIPTRIKTVVHEDEVDKIVAAYSIAEEINLEKLKDSFQKKGLYNLVPLPADAEALMFRAIYPIDENDREIFIFKKGSAVFWNFTATETDEIIKHIEVFSQNLEPVVEKEFLDYRLTQTPSKLVGERIELNEKTEHLKLEKYACSDALTQSVLLKAIEDSVQDLSVSMEEIARNLKEGIKIQLTQREVLQQTGEIFVFRCKINLSADFLDTPDFYWERDNLESIYQSIYSHLIIGKRTRILNERIELCSDLTHLIHNKLTDKTHIKLEKYIIALILIEVAFETVHAFTRWLS